MLLPRPVTVVFTMHIEAVWTDLTTCKALCTIEAIGLPQTAS
jgi:hypothetical protein